MADFFLSDHSDDSAVEDIISQAKDLSLLEQVSAINCSGFTDSVLPSELEQRFRKLKSFPATSAKHKSKPSIGKTYSMSKFINTAESEREEQNDGKVGLEKKSVLYHDFSPLHSWDSSVENDIFSEAKEYPVGKVKLKSEKKAKWFSSPLSSTNSSRDSPSPPRKNGCFWCSPKRITKQRSKEDLSMVGKNDEFLSDLSTFSVKEQQKMLKKAMKEEEKVSKEAEKIVMWAKQASMRMSVHDDSDNELSDD